VLPPEVDEDRPHRRRDLDLALGSWQAGVDGDEAGHDLAGGRSARIAQVKDLTRLDDAPLAS
jgi:hypothetical protein